MIDNIIAFIGTHIEQITVFALTAITIARGGQSTAKSQILSMALDLVRDVAASELSNPEKRKWVVEAIKDRAPILTKALSDQSIELIVENAYLLLKADLKNK